MGWGQAEKWKQRGPFEETVVIQAEGQGSSDQDGSRRGSETWAGFGAILKVKPTSALIVGWGLFQCLEHREHHGGVCKMKSGHRVPGDRVEWFQEPGRVRRWGWKGIKVKGLACRRWTVAWASGLIVLTHKNREERAQ